MTYTLGPNEQRFLLEELFARGPLTEDALEAAIGVDQIDLDDIAAWAIGANAQGVIERAGARRWQITDMGRRAIGNEPGR